MFFASTNDEYEHCIRTRTIIFIGRDYNHCMITSQPRLRIYYYYSVSVLLKQYFVENIGNFRFDIRFTPSLKIYIFIYIFSRTDRTFGYESQPNCVAARRLKDFFSEKDVSFNIDYLRISFAWKKKNKQNSSP